FLFGEDQARYLLSTAIPDQVLDEANAAGVPAALVGFSRGETITVEGLFSLPLAELQAAHEAWLPAFMA
ncbi:MAG TPA: hypothetical protein VG227_10300, partial [Caulobacteraceae bacterium]|nr:hypothetical protein [Caulobacteraceae bacterium]